MQSRTAPPFDPELVEALRSARSMYPSVTVEGIAGRRANPIPEPTAEELQSVGAIRAEHTATGFNGAEMALSVFRDPRRVAPGPVIYYIHGGGMMFGNRLAGVQRYLPWIASHGAAVVSVEYRLAPEHPDPAPVEDCYAGLLWTVAHAADLKIDVERMVVAGVSAGGGLAAGTVLLARDRGGPSVLAQQLLCPMLDDRNDSISARQIDGIGLWDKDSNDVGWDALLGDRRGTENVSPYAAPARAADLSGLPPTFIDVGSAEVFRDESVEFATRLWASGGSAELHVWPGGFHGFDATVPDAQISRAAVAARESWLRRILAT